MKAYLLLLATIFSLGLSAASAQSSKMPQDNWCVQKATDQDNHLVFITSNLGYRNYPHKAEFPWCLAINMTILDKSPIGHPTTAEAPFLNEAEDVITAALEKDGIVHFVGRTTVNGFRELYYFVADPEKANLTLTRLTKAPQTRTWEYHMEKDEQWLRVAPFFSANAKCL